MVVEKLVTRMVVKTLLIIGRSTEGEKPAKMLLLFVMSSWKIGLWGLAAGESKNTDVLDNRSKCQKTTGLLWVKLKISD